MSAAGAGDGSPAPRPTFGDRLAGAVAARESQIVLGIDPDPARLWPGALDHASQARADLAEGFADAHEIARGVTGDSAPEPQPPALEAAAAVLAHSLALLAVGLADVGPQAGGIGVDPEDDLGLAALDGRGEPGAERGRR